MEVFQVIIIPPPCKSTRYPLSSLSAIPSLTISVLPLNLIGHILSLCLRSGSGDLHDFETLKFIFLHELTHIAADVYQHPTKFWQLFKILLQEAEIAGIYSPIDYGASPIRYCGKLTVSYNPYYDDTLQDIE